MDAAAASCRFAVPVEFGLRLLATASRPNICSSLAAFAAKVTQTQVYGMFCINGRIRAAKQWQHEVSLKCKSVLEIRKACLVGWSDADRVDQSREGKRRLGYVSGFSPAPLAAPAILPTGPPLYMSYG